ncbi:hypothetical protein LCGC14_2640350, partial [marine sediment metagenome]
PHVGKVWDQKTLKWVKKEETSDYYKPKIGKLPFSVGYDRKDYSKEFSLKYKNMSEEEFKKNYHVCAYCDGDLGEDGYITSIIVDTGIAICDKCVSLSETCGMPFSKEGIQ